MTGRSDGSGDQEQHFADLQAQLAAAHDQLAAFRRFAIPRIFSALPLALLIPFIAFAGLALAFGLGANATTFGIAGGGIAVLIATICILHFLGLAPSRPSATACATRSPRQTGSTPRARLPRPSGTRGRAQRSRPSLKPHRR